MKATLHPNGFWVILLGSLFGFRLRLHYWPDATEDKSPHNHRSWFISLPLFGELMETTYEEVPGDEPVRVCGSLPGNGIPDTIEGRAGALRAGLIRRHRLLLPYLCKAEAIHSVIVPNKTATLILFGPDKQRPKAWIEWKQQN